MQAKRKFQGASAENIVWQRISFRSELYPGENGRLRGLTGWTTVLDWGINP